MFRNRACQRERWGGVLKAASPLSRHYRASLLFAQEQSGSRLLLFCFLPFSPQNYHAPPPTSSARYRLRARRMGGGLTPPPELLAEWATNRERFPYGERRGPFLLVLLGILLALTLAVVAARLWARCKIRRNAGLDDWLIVAALVSHECEHPPKPSLTTTSLSLLPTTSVTFWVCNQPRSPNESPT